jgi:hypothetical protein
MVRVTIGSTALAHLQDTSPGSLTDDQLNLWGYEDPYLPEGQSAEEFVKECREAVNTVLKTRRVGKRGYRQTVEFPTKDHALACAYKLEDVGNDFAYGSGFDPEARPEGRAMLKGAEQIKKAAEA